MTSEERHAARRKRREALREAKRLAYNAPYDSYDAVIDANALWNAMCQSRKGVRWKGSVQRYCLNALRETCDLRAKLKAGVSPVMGFIEFTLSERGKTRQIRSVHFKERVVQRSLCDNALVPVLRRSLVYDNGASMKGKGIHFAMFRLSRQLHRYYRENSSNEGHILLIDFSKYFDNIDHGCVKQIILKNFSDRRLRWLIWRFVKSFGEKSLGIGSQISQIFAVSYPGRIDHYIREIWRIGLGGRYMDDSQYMSRNADDLAAMFADILPMLNELKIAVNQRKTHIIPLKRFTFLGVRYRLTKSGKVIMKPKRESFKRMRRKMRTFRELLDVGEMSMDEIIQSYQSWYGYQKHLDCHNALRDMDKRFYDTFGMWVKHKKKRKRKEFYR